MSALSFPPEFPELPSGYSDWDADGAFYLPPLENLPFETWPAHFPPYTDFPGDSNYVSMYDSKVPVIRDRNRLPFRITLEDMNHWEGSGDEVYGKCKYSPNTGRSREGISIYWSPHEEGLTERDIANRLVPRDYSDCGIANHLAVEKNLTKMRIGDVEVYRHRSKWWVEAGCSCGRYDEQGSATVYFIPGQKRDFHITCVTETYAFDGNPWQGYSVEELDTLPRVLIEHRPDRISDLERAVETSFVPKEPDYASPNEPTFLGPALPRDYTPWQPRFTLCREDRKLAYLPGYEGFCLGQPADSELLFTLKFDNMQPGLIVADSFCGMVSFFPVDDSIYHGVEVYWRPANFSLHPDTVKAELASLIAPAETYISLDTKGVEELTINLNRAFRLRAFRYDADEDSGTVTIYAVTAYLIHSERYNFVVVCSAPIYRSDSSGLEKTFPEHISVLERGVEETFRPR